VVFYVLDLTGTFLGATHFPASAPQDFLLGKCVAPRMVFATLERILRI
jgi:hypothetical protein